MVLPAFAPGIVFNTIKSGIAVDYPIISTPERVHRSYLYRDGQPSGSDAYLSGTDNSENYNYHDLYFQVYLKQEVELFVWDSLRFSPSSNIHFPNLEFESGSTYSLNDNDEIAMDFSYGYFNYFSPATRCLIYFEACTLAPTYKFMYFINVKKKHIDRHNKYI